MNDNILEQWSHFKSRDRHCGTTSGYLPSDPGWLLVETTTNKRVAVLVGCKRVYIRAKITSNAFKRAADNTEDTFPQALLQALIVSLKIRNLVSYMVVRK
jgi:hypothetical protein